MCVNIVVVRCLEMLVSISYLMIVIHVITGKDCTQNFVSCGEFCISEQLRCNGVVNCPDGGDERNCPDVNTSQSGVKPGFSFCSSFVNKHMS